MKHLWIDLDMARAYPEPEMMKYIMDRVEEDGVKLETVEEDVVRYQEVAREVCMHVMEVREETKPNPSNIMLMETVTEPKDDNKKGDEEIMLLPTIANHIPEGLVLQIALENQHHGDQGGPQAEDRDGDGQDGGGAGGSRQEHGERDDSVLMKTSSTNLQLVRRKYRLKVGVRRDGLLQPTVNNFFVNNSGRGATNGLNEIMKTGSGIRKEKRKLECTVVVADSLAKRQKTK
jgi:hypothetical protein